jgi:molybdopterin-containing oxidoreductase family membrane subunit
MVRKRAYGAFRARLARQQRHWRTTSARTYPEVSPRPLVLSVHSVVSFDLRDHASCPGWHTTILPAVHSSPAAVFSGFAMVLTLLIIARTVLRS